MQSEKSSAPYNGGAVARVGFGIPVPVSISTPQQAFRDAYECSQALVGNLQDYEQQASKVMETIHHLSEEVEALRRHCEDAVNERQYLDDLTAQAEDRLRDVRRLADRYTAVKDPVVASDGFTYERAVLTEYLNSCSKEGTEAVSNQTQEPMTSLLIPNRSLKTLLERLVELLQSTNVVSANTDTGTDRSVNALNTNSSVTENTSSKGYMGNDSADQRLHPCIRVYGYCHYKDGCAYAKYPYEACLSNLKGKCRFRNQCHERHVEFVGPLDDNGHSLSRHAANDTAHSNGVAAATSTATNAALANPCANNNDSSSLGE